MRSSSTAPDSNLDKLATNAKRDIAKYRATLPPVLAMFERELERQTELAAVRQDLYERGALSESEVRAGKRALAAARKDVEDTRRDMAAADRMMGEARMADVARARPLARGQYEEIAGLVRFAGLAEWSLAADTPKLQRFFQSASCGPSPSAPSGRPRSTIGWASTIAMPWTWPFIPTARRAAPS